MNGVLRVGSVLTTCFKGNTKTRVLVYLQDPLNPQEFINSTRIDLIELKDCLRIIENFENVASDVVKVSEDDVYLLQAAFCQYVDVFLPEERGEIIGSMEEAEEATIRRSSRKRKHKQKDDFMHMPHD